MHVVLRKLLRHFRIDDAVQQLDRHRTLAVVANVVHKALDQLAEASCLLLEVLARWVQVHLEIILAYVFDGGVKCA